MTAAATHQTPPPHPATEVHRPLDPLERWYWITDRISPLNVISRVRVWGSEPTETWRAALDTVQARHPLLRVAITEDQDSAGPWFRPVTGRPIPLRHAEASAADEPAWQRELNTRELAEPVDWATGPLARALLVSGTEPSAGHAPYQDLVLTLPHCVADGTTVLSLLRDWVESAAAHRAAPYGQRDLPPPQHGARRALPPLSELLPTAHRGQPGIRRGRHQRAADEELMARLSPLRVEPRTAVPFRERRTRLIHRSLDPDTLAALTAACRREQCTVHGALAAAMATAVAHHADLPLPGHVAIGSPVDFRGELAPPVGADEVGSFVATVPTAVELRPGAGLWPAARAIAGDLVRRKDAGEHFCAVNTFSELCPAGVAEAEPMVRFMDDHGPINLCLSNIGRYDFPSDIGPWQLSGAQFVAGLSVNAQLVATTNTSHGRLHWNFTHVDGALPGEAVRRLVDDCVATLLAAIGAPPTR